MRAHSGAITGLLVIALLCSAAPVLAADPQDSVGVVDQATGMWFLRDPAMGKTTSFFFGNPGDVPVIGDWDCDGDDTPGLYRQSDGFVYLRNSNTQGIADIRFFFGNPADIPLAGDFNGDGCDTISIYRPSEGKVFIINELGKNNAGLGAAEFDYFFGNPGDKPFVGDFDNDGVDTIGLHRESTGLVYFRNTHTQGIADEQFIYGDPGDKIIAGDWAQKEASGSDTVGIFRPSEGKVYLRFTNTQGIADEEFQYGNARMLPVAGDFGLSPDDDPPPPGPIPGQHASVIDVIDGDTVQVDLDGNVVAIRLIGIDAPEPPECFYTEAKNRLTQLIAGKDVTLVSDVEDSVNGKLLRYVYLGTEHINRTMVRQGFALESPSPGVGNQAKRDELESAEQAAMAEMLGLWAACDF